MYCTNCKKEFEGNFCPNCGTKAPANPLPGTYQNPYSQSANPQRSKGGWNPPNKPEEPNIKTSSGNSQQTNEFQPSIENPPSVHTSNQKRGLNLKLLLIMIGLPILLCLAVGYIRNFILLQTYTNSAWQDDTYPDERVKALNSVLLKTEVKNITSITPSVTNNDEVTMMAGEHEQTSYIISFDGDKISKITSKYGVLYDEGIINESYFYWENRSNLEFTVEAEAFVRGYLKSPSSAEFSPTGTCKREKDRVIITSSVTADNSFGVPVSQSYTIVIQQSASDPDKYTLAYLKLGDDVLVNK